MSVRDAAFDAATGAEPASAASTKRSSSRALAYRPDIDGLRAVAVLLVLFYHLNIGPFGGGFIGVDIFFVISGYLISSIIFADIAASQFSISGFYERRIRRIAPALVAMLLITSALAYVYLLPNDLVNFSWSLLATALSASNIYYWHEQTNYFAPLASMEPLLHTWSLAVEEQFYLFFPLFLWLVQRWFPTRLRHAVLLAAGISFALSLIGPSFSKAANFFLLPTRAWELLLGTILSIELLPVISTRLWRNVATGTGLLAIMVPAFFYSYTTPFPGFAALPPCIGAALVIAGGNAGTSVGGRLLSLRPVVWVGLISYSLYLWHWPIMVFRNLDTLLMAGSPPVTDKYAEFAAAVIIATLSWKFVESPFRKGPLRMSGANLFKVASASVVVTASIAGAFLFLGGLPFRFSPEVIRAASYLGNVPVREYRGGTCLTSPNRLNDFNKAVCLKVDEAKKNYLLLGDSYAAHLWYGLSNVMVDRNVMQATQAQCNAMIEPAADATESCRGLIDFIYGDYLTTHRIDALLLAQRWAEGDLPRLSKTIAWAKQRGIEVILFGPMLEYDMPLPVLHAYQIKNGLAQENGRHRNPRPKRIEERMTELNEKEWKIHYVSFFKALCEKATCIETASDGAQLQFDAGHLTKEGSLLVAQRIRADGDLP